MTLNWLLGLKCGCTPIRWGCYCCQSEEVFRDTTYALVKIHLNEILAEDNGFNIQYSIHHS